MINTLQKLLFCIAKAAVLHGKSVCFALQKSRFRNVKSKLPFSFRIIFTKPSWFLYLLQTKKGDSFPQLFFYRS
ncbi:hypothetical protein CTM58_05555 [Prevotella intermedia]|uniref:Uncharacterized protein n=1 Tax=Prevotella intermedia TaxID=28131 RepID=A0A2M8TUL9_PREIN|nr:hypothetical protein CTM58_05555 [Prevotella intermedia]